MVLSLQKRWCRRYCDECVDCISWEPLYHSTTYHTIVAIADWYNSVWCFQFSWLLMESYSFWKVSLSYWWKSHEVFEASISFLCCALHNDVGVDWSILLLGESKCMRKGPLICWHSTRCFQLVVGTSERHDFRVYSTSDIPAGFFWSYLISCLDGIGSMKETSR